MSPLVEADARVDVPPVGVSEAGAVPGPALARAQLPALRAAHAQTLSNTPR